MNRPDVHLTEQQTTDAMNAFGLIWRDRHRIGLTEAQQYALAQIIRGVRLLEIEALARRAMRDGGQREYIHLTDRDAADIVTVN